MKFLLRLILATIVGVIMYSVTLRNIPMAIALIAFLTVLIGK